MKLILCTLAVCLTVAVSTLTTQELIRAEARRTRAAAPKALTEPLEAGAGGDSVVQRLDAVSGQLAALGRRLAALESGAPAPERPAPAPAPLAAEPASADVRALADTVRALASSQDRLAGVPRYLTDLSTYLDRSFANLERKVDERALPEDVAVTLDWMVEKVDNIDRYFTPLYAFLGLVYDPENEDLLAEYPSVDVRINELFVELEQLRQDVADIRRNMIVPTVREPTRYQR